MKTGNIDEYVCHCECVHAPADEFIWYERMHTDFNELTNWFPNEKHTYYDSEVRFGDMRSTDFISC